MNNKIVVLIILIISIGAIYYYNGGTLANLDNASNFKTIKNRVVEESVKIGKRIAIDRLKGDIATTTDEQTQSVSNENQDKIEQVEPSASVIQGHISAIVNDFNNIVSERFEISGKAQIERFWVVGDKDMYVEYRDGKGFRRLLITISEQGDNISYSAIGYFIPSENGWNLTIGQDKQFGGKAFILYEFNQRSGAWERQN